MADAADLKSAGEILVGSTPTPGTNKNRSSKPISRVLSSETNRSGDHLSSPNVTIRVKRPTLGQAGHPFQAPRKIRVFWKLLSLYLVLLQMGFAQPAGHPAAGELLPHHFTLIPKDGIVSVALSVGSPLLGVTQHLARWSSDFPPFYKRAVTRFT